MLRGTDEMRRRRLSGRPFPNASDVGEHVRGERLVVLKALVDDDREGAA